MNLTSTDGSKDETSKLEERCLSACPGVLVATLAEISLKPVQVRLERSWRLKRAGLNSPSVVWGLKPSVSGNDRYLEHR